MILLLLVFTIFSCNKSEDMIVESEKETYEIPIVNFTKIKNTLADELARLDEMKNEEAFLIEKDVFNVYLKEYLDLKDKIGLTSVREAALYEQKGFDDYINIKVREGVFTEKQKEILLQTKLEFSQMIDQEPSFEEVSKFFLAKSSEIENNSTLGQEEKFELDMFFHGAIGSAKHLYRKAFALSGSNPSVQKRGCNVG